MPALNETAEMPACPPRRSHLMLEHWGSSYGISERRLFTLEGDHVLFYPEEDCAPRPLTFAQAIARIKQLVAQGFYPARPEEAEEFLRQLGATGPEPGSHAAWAADLLKRRWMRW